MELKNLSPQGGLDAAHVPLLPAAPVTDTTLSHSQMNKYEYTVTSGSAGARLDVYLSNQNDITRSHIQRLIKQGFVKVNSDPKKISYRVRDKDHIEVFVPFDKDGILIPENIPLTITWEDDSIIVINKPPHMVVYPAAGNKSGTLMNALVFHCKNLSSRGAPLRPGIVHRLDKNTSGLIVVAKDNRAYYSLVEQFKYRSVEKQYMALIYGHVKGETGEIKKLIGRAVSDRKRMSTKTKRGKEAVTQFTVIKRFEQASLVKIRILTGRTHQIRVHFASIGNPVLGDTAYGRKTSLKAGKRIISFPRQMLHACYLKLKHPATGEIMAFEAPLPADMEEAIKELQT